MLPSKIPQRSQIDVLDFLSEHGVNYSEKVILLGVRGYYRDSMGAKFKNDRAIYDDAAFWIYDTVAFQAFNFNTDPSGYRKGYGTGSKKGMANLKNGIWLYQKGLHRGYQAFTQAKAVTVVRDGSPNYEDTGWFGINIHKGGNSGTSSLGCQTVPVAQWNNFKSLGYSLLDQAKQKTFQYVLVDEAETGWNT